MLPVMVAKAVGAICVLLKAALQLACSTGQCRVQIITLVFAPQIKPLRPDPNVRAESWLLCRESNMTVANGGELPPKTP
jgi:hypothetical protein